MSERLKAALFLLALFIGGCCCPPQEKAGAIAETAQPLPPGWTFADTLLPLDSGHTPGYDPYWTPLERTAIAPWDTARLEAFDARYH